MRKFIFVVLLLQSLAVLGNGGDIDYAVSRIPAGLLKNVNVVKRTEEIRFQISEKNKATYYRKVAYTILNDLGERWGYFSEGYDKLRSIESFEGSLFDANGKKLKSLKKGDIKDMSGNDEALADDNRYKWHSFFYKVYPYTVEYEVEVSFKGTMFLPDWIPQEKEVMSVEQSRLVVSIPMTNPLHYKMFNYPGEPVISEEKSNKIYTWEIKEIHGTESEYSSPSWHTITTSVFLATEKFVLEDYEGSNSSWKDFGRFVNDLKKERDVLPDNLKQQVHQLVDGVSDRKEKISRLYEFMQQNTRFISIQLGVGGWQPFDAKFVGTKKYGDCKALSNFMYSLLKEAGIKSVYTVTGRGDDQDYFLTDFPCSQFNHVILFVPFENDTTWLECTSQTLSPGYVGGDNSNRYALAVDENGGTLVRTPGYGLQENLRTRHASAVVDETGNLQTVLVSKYRAEQHDRLHEIITGLSKDKLMEFLKEDIDLATYDVRSFDYKEEKGKLPVITEKLEIEASNYATVSGKRFFIVPNIISRANRKLKTDEDRKNDLILEVEFRNIDTAEIIIPGGYAPESLPKDVTIESKFGKYTAIVKLDSNKITYYRNYEHYSGRFPAKDYPNLVKFYEAIYKADRNKVVLVKNETATQKGF